MLLFFYMLYEEEKCKYYCCFYSFYLRLSDFSEFFILNNLMVFFKYLWMVVFIILLFLYMKCV